MSTSPLQSRRAFTLLELVVGLALLATLVVGTLLALRLHQRQIASAERKIAAVAALDQLVASWYLAEQIPSNASGTTGPQNEWSWQAVIVQRRQIGPRGFAVVRVSLWPALPANGSGNAPPTQAASASVELLIPAPK